MSDTPPQDEGSITETVDLNRSRPPVVHVDWRPGEVIAGRYQILRKLGSGGMGIVAQADDLFLRKPVAIKALRPDVAADPIHVERFRKEVALAHTVTHPNIARTYDLGEFNGIHYFSMEYLEGTPLNQRLMDQKRLTLREVRELVIPICHALEAAHRAKIIHRDLKPSNLMLVDDPRRVVIMDFGISGVLGAHEHHEQLARDMPALTDWEVTSVGMGTPQYMSPEQWLGEPCGPQSDVYSMGCILFQCLTGRPPFRGNDKTYYFNAHVTEPAPRLRSIDPSLPKRVDAVIARCLEKEPADRYPNCRELSEAIAGRGSLISWLRFGLWAVLLALLLAGLAWGTIDMAEEAIKTEMKPAVVRLAQLVSQQFTPDLLETIRIDSPHGSPAFQRAQETLIPIFLGEAPPDTPLERATFLVYQVFQQVLQDNPGVKWIYILRKLDDSLVEEQGVWWEFVVDGDPLPEDLDHNGILEGEEQGAMPGHRYDSSDVPAMLRCLASGQPDNDDDFLTDAYGYTLSGYAPIGEQTGPGGYILGVDVDNSRLQTFRMVIISLCTLVWLVLLILTRIFEFRAIRKRSEPYYTPAE
ncbi:MAG: serine/threonine protein kinase [Bradymonadales bacterium]|nr:serine/threonine protein kinase [Bradymonadales bacterium]